MRNIACNYYPLTLDNLSTYLKETKNIDRPESMSKDSNAATNGFIDPGNDLYGSIEGQSGFSGLKFAPQRIITKTLFLLGVFLLFFSSTVSATVIRDQYWGGNSKIQKDFLGKHSDVTDMEVMADDEKITVTISGPFFYNYVHHIKGADKTPPGDLYIASTGWKVKGKAPYTRDTFTKDEGWDYVVSLFDKAVYKLDWSKIQWTRPKPGTIIYRADQAWRGGYGSFVNWADIKLTDKSLVISFPINAIIPETISVEQGIDSAEQPSDGTSDDMNAGEDVSIVNIGLHWTMMCGNDVIEGEFGVPVIIYSDYEEAETMVLPRPALWAPPKGPGLTPWGRDFAAGTFPYFQIKKGDDHNPTHRTPEPSMTLLLLGGLAAVGFLIKTRRKP